MRNACCTHKQETYEWNQADISFWPDQLFGGFPLGTKLVFSKNDWVQLSTHVLQVKNSLVVIFVISKQVDTFNSFLIILGMHLLLFISTTT
jgi:hypothetical protein